MWVILVRGVAIVCVGDMRVGNCMGICISRYVCVYIDVCDWYWNTLLQRGRKRASL